MTQSLMFMPVIHCEEGDLYFIVVECITPALCFLRLSAYLGTIFLLLGPGVIPASRIPRRLQPAADHPHDEESPVRGSWVVPSSLAVFS